MYTLKEKITPSRTGGDNKLKHISAIDMMQDCSLLWLGSEPDFDKYLKDNNYGLFIVYRQIDFLKRPSYGEELSVSTSIFESKPIMGKRNTCIYDSHNEPCVLSWSVGVFVDLAANKLIKVDKSVAENIVIDKEVSMEYTPKKIILPEKESEYLPPVKVPRSYIDRYRHVNNARYIEKAMEFLPDDFDIKRVRIEYKSPAKLGDNMLPEYICDEGRYFIKLNNKAGEPYIVSEFSAF